MMEKLYTDFTEKLLPIVAQGIQITFDYFTNLFGRYVEYLILTDSIVMIGTLSIFIVTILFLIKNWKAGTSSGWEDGANFFGVAI